ncbi:hypothetical protein CUR86_06105 [Salinicola acroporae]|uniref:KANL3/Tex30 alpha/beta hydrolase-like domain-containing protein n=1 Tax=Salinicola acroporae TaxID=1541440 RepID=A0ABT6I315_9GAMM|nr:hypothetical protein [Salinicola acroporae]
MQEIQDIDRLREALAVGDGARHATSSGGFIVEGQAPTSARFVLCHGAGAGHDSEFLARLRRQLAERGIQVVAVEFDYMTVMGRSGRRRPPPRIETLVDELAGWRRRLTELDAQTPLWFGGKSMGGRVASLLATRVDLAGLVLFGYPFHPPASLTVCDSSTGRRSPAPCCCSREPATRSGGVMRSRDIGCRRRSSVTSWRVETMTGRCSNVLRTRSRY